MSAWGSIVLDPAGTVRAVDGDARTLLGGDVEPGLRLGALVAADERARFEEALAATGRGERATLELALVGGGRIALALAPAEADGLREARVLPLVRAGAGATATAPLDQEALARAISHDVRAPLRAVEAFADFLAEDAGTLEERAADDLARLRGAALRLRGRLDALVWWLRAGRAVPGSCSARQVARAVAERLGPRFRERGGSLEVTGPDATIPVAAEDLDEQLARLVSNALDHNEGAVHARIEIVPGPGTVSVAVVDDGRGMDDAARTRGPELFQRTAPRAREDVHAGAGLAIVERAARAWGGSLALEAARPRGLVARIVVPAGRGAADLPAEAA